MRTDREARTGATAGGREEARRRDPVPEEDESTAEGQYYNISIISRTPWL